MVFVDDFVVGVDEFYVDVVEIVGLVYCCV